MGTYEQCPLKYKFRYIERIPEKGEKSVAASRGITHHKAIEDFINIGAPLPQTMSFYESFLSGLRGHGVAEHKVALDSKWQVVAWDAEDVWLKAVLDYKVPQPPKLTIYDWKTGKIYPDHDDQKHLYAMIEFAEHPDVIEIDAIHMYVDLRKNTKKTYRREWVEAGRQKWQHRVDVMENDKGFIPNPTYGCRFCPYRKEVGGPCRF